MASQATKVASGHGTYPAVPCGVSFAADSMQFDNLSALTSKTNVTGYYGGLRLLRAACKKYARAYVPATGLVVLLGTQRRVPQPQRGRFRTGEVFFAVPLRSAAPQLLLIDRSAGSASLRSPTGSRRKPAKGISR